MKIAIHFRDDIEPNSYSRKWKEELEKRGIEVLAIDFKQSDIINKVRGCDGVMWHWYHNPDDKQSAPKILTAIELGLGIPVFPNIYTGWHYDEKVAQHFLFDSICGPKIKSWVFWKYNDALEFLTICKFPIVFKLSVGAGSANVLKLESYKEAKKIVDRIFIHGVIPYTYNENSWGFILKYPRLFFNRTTKLILSTIFQKYKLPDYFLIQKNYAYFQEFIPNNKFDIRITVIGNRAFGFIRYNRDNDFRASGSGKLDYDIRKIPLECVKIAHEISKNSGFQSMAYDFLIDPDGKPVIGEISYCYVNVAIYNCSGYWDRDLRWIEGHVWPEHAQVEDFVNLIEEKKKVSSLV